MFLFESWLGRFLILYALWPLFVMIAWVLWHSGTGKTLVGFLKGLMFVATFAVMALLFWFLGSIAFLALVAWLADSSGATDSESQLGLLGLMVVAMIVGAVRFWRWLSSEMTTDLRNWKL